MTSGERITEQQRRTILRMHAQRLSHHQIASHVGCCTRSVKRVIDDAARWYWAYVRAVETDHELRGRE